MEITSIRKCIRRVDGRVECNQKPSKKEIAQLGKKIEKELKGRVIECSIATPLPKRRYYTDEGKRHVYVRDSGIKGNKINIAECRITERYAKKYGKNVGGNYTQKRTRFMGWEDWVEFNNAINDVLDREYISANAKSLGGQFVQRRGTERMSREDWEHGFGTNVGSYMSPISRGEMYQPEGRGRVGWRRDIEMKKVRLAEQQHRHEQGIREKYPSMRVAKAHKKLYGEY